MSLKTIQSLLDRGAPVDLLKLWEACFTFGLRLLSEGLVLARHSAARSGRLALRMDGDSSVVTFFVSRRKMKKMDASVSERRGWREKSL